MAVTSGFFNSIDGDRKYNAEQIGNYFEGLVGNGVFENVDNKLVVTATSGLNISVGTGRAMVNCHWVKNSTILSLTLDSADVQYARIDAVVVKLDLNNSSRTVSIEIKKGTPSLTPSRPALTRTNEIYELCLATIRIPAKATSISQSNITDTRGNTTLCGYVTGLIKQVDTTDLFLQYQTALDEIIAQRTAQFDAWFKDLTEELRVDTKLEKYENTVQITNDYTYSVKIGIPEFEEGDILLVHINGVFLTENEDFTVTAYGENGKITALRELDAGNSITFIVIKSVIGVGGGGYKISAVNIQSKTISDLQNTSTIQTDYNRIICSATGGSGTYAYKVWHENATATQEISIVDGSTVGLDGQLVAILPNDWYTTLCKIWVIVTDTAGVKATKYFAFVGT